MYTRAWWQQYGSAYQSLTKAAQEKRQARTWYYNNS